MKRIWQTSWAPWALTVLILVGAYILAVNSIYLIVGGME